MGTETRDTWQKVAAPLWGHRLASYPLLLGWLVDVASGLLFLMPLELQGRMADPELFSAQVRR